MYGNEVNILFQFSQEGAFALCFKSRLYPGECVATRRGSPLLVGLKTNTRLATDHVPVFYSKGKPFYFAIYAYLQSRDTNDTYIRWFSRNTVNESTYIIINLNDIIFSLFLNIQIFPLLILAKCSHELQFYSYSWLIEYPLSALV